MAKRLDYTDKLLHLKDHDISSFYNNNNFRQTTRIDTLNLTQTGFLVDVVNLGQGKRLSFLYESSHTFHGGYSDEMEGTSNFARDDFITSPGLYNVSYWGNRRYIRLKVINRNTNPQGRYRFYFYRGGLYSNPQNLYL